MTLEERIVGEASALFAEMGIKAVSMDLIAQRVGISKRTLYETYSSKDELLVRCLKHMHEKHSAEVKERLATTDDFVEILIIMLDDAMKQLRGFNQLFYMEMSRYHYLAASEAFRDEQERKRTALVKFLHKGQAEGYVEAQIDVEVTADVFLNQHLFSSRSVLTEKYTADRVFRSIFVTLFRGICTLKGCERFDTLMEQKGY